MGAGGAGLDAVAAPVADAVSAGADPTFALVGEVFQAVQTGNWALAAALGLVGVCWALRRWGPRLLPASWGAALASDAGGAVLVLLTGVAGAVAAALGSGHGLSLDVLRRAFEVGFAAAGGYATAKKIGKAVLSWLARRTAPSSTSPTSPPATPPGA